MTLESIYSQYVPTAGEVDLGEILFKAAYPDDEKGKEAKRLRRKSEDLFEDFPDAWEKRVREGVRAELRAGSSMHTILKLVPYITSDELKVIIKKLDEFIPDGEIDPNPSDYKLDDRVPITSNGFAKFALKIRELEANIMSLQQGAAGIMKEEIGIFQEEESKKKIITRPPLITGV